MERKSRLVEKHHGHGLIGVNVFFNPTHDNKTSRDSVRISFFHPRRQRNATYLAEQTKKHACNSCPLRNGSDGVICSGPEVDDLNQLHATLTSSHSLSEENWSKIVSQAGCEPGFK